ncbi:MAG: putative Ig domain-containing protein [Myxococcota bacterium]
MVTMLLFGLACSGGAPPEPVKPAEPDEPVGVVPAPILEVERNRPPRITQIRLEPDPPNTTTPLRAVLDVTDPEGQRLNTSYTWFVNGKKILEERRPQLAETYFKRGDRIRISVVVTDEDITVEADSEITIGNAPPAFTTDPGALRRLDGFTVEAEDPDGDPLTYSLSGAPQGMAIDARSGELSYTGDPKEPGGPYTVQIRAADPKGAQARWEFQVNIQPGSDAPP